MHAGAMHLLVTGTTLATTLGVVVVVVGAGILGGGVLVVVDGSAVEVLDGTVVVAVQLLLTCTNNPN